MRTINLCADDFGHHPAVNQAILDLLGQGRLSTTSVITNAPFFEQDADKLKRWANYQRAGLHINLTEFNAISAGGRSVIQPLSSLVYKAYRGKLSTTAVAEEIEAQLQAFSNHFGVLPSYIDGHQHVHQLPTVRRALFQVYQRFYPQSSAMIRVSDQPFKITSLAQWRLGLKPMLVRLIGAKRLRRLLQRSGIPHNQSFAGIYHFKANEYRAYFQYFLRQLDHEGWLMCHPGATLITDDPIAKARVKEYAYLSSLAFNEDCNAAGIVLA